VGNIGETEEIIEITPINEPEVLPSTEPTQSPVGEPVGVPA